MNKEFVEILWYVNYLGLDNGRWGFVSDIDTKAYFGTDFKTSLIGTWLYIMLPSDSDSEIEHLKNIMTPNYIVNSEVLDSYVLLYDTLVED